MNNKKISIVLLIFFSIVISTCSESTNPILPPDTEPDELVPLKIGNSWSFKITTYDTLGAIDWIDTLTIFIKKDTVVNNVLWFLQGSNRTMLGQTGFRNDTIGHHVTNFESYSITYPYPAEVGESLDGFTVTSKDSLIQTNLGKLKCYVYNRYFYDFSYNTIYSPGIGLIYSETPMRPYNSDTTYLIQTRELVSTNVQLKQ